MSNKTAYKQKAIVDYYCQENGLQLPEQTIFKLLENHLSEIKMLDIGIGGGRTTSHFGDLVKEYHGVDYSEEMVDACKTRFSDAPDNLSFQVCDVRDMRAFDDNSFDFILFSFNGIDSISHEDRVIALQEIQRVGKPGGYFCFSTHNLNCAEKIFNFKSQLDGPPHKIFKRVIKWSMLNFIFNKYRDIKVLKQSEYAILNDGLHLFKIKNYYIKPLEQIRQLQGGFENIKVFSLNTGKEIATKSELQTTQDPWLYFFCMIKES